jgi:putative protease
MKISRRHLELLSPAKNADFGIEAVNHGADAVYIGGPAYGARAAANSIEDVARFVEHAHRFNAEVFVTLNTIFHDNELEGAREIVYQLYDSGVDALIVQDMGLMEMDLPPIQLHASTQTDIRTVEKARFLDQVGFSANRLGARIGFKNHSGNRCCNYLQFRIFCTWCIMRRI